MKKIHQFGLFAALIVMLPTGSLFAGNGNGDGKGTKNTISFNCEKSKNVVLLVNTTEMMSTADLIGNGDIVISTPTAGASIKEINAVTNGVEVVIVINHEEYSPGSLSNTDGIIIEIVGVDNITGITVSDAESGNTMSTHIATHVIDDGITHSDGNTGNGNSNGSNMQGNPNSTPNFVPALGTGRDEVAIYPNPVVDQTNVVTVGEILGKSIVVLDLSGHTVMNLNVSPHSRQTTLNLSGLTPGLYILNYQTEDGRTISKRIQKI